MSSNRDTETRAPGGTATLAGHRVARIGFGVMQLTEHRPGRPPVSGEDAVAILRTAIDSGVNHLDTAEFYGTHDANANDLIRAALHPYADHLVLATKVGAERDDAGALVPAQRPEQLRASVEANLARLGTDRLAVVNLRRLDELVALGHDAGLCDEGKIDEIGRAHV